MDINIAMSGLSFSQDKWNREEILIEATEGNDVSGLNQEGAQVSEESSKF